MLILCGIAVRLLSPTAALFAGSVIAGVGIAVGNVLMPAVVKRHFPERTGPAMAVYSVALNGARHSPRGSRSPSAMPWTSSGGPRSPPGACSPLPPPWCGLRWPHRVRAHPDDDGQTYSVWRSSLAWAAAAFIGLQSVVFFALTAWVPTLLQDAGMAQARAGLMLSLLALFGIVGGLSCRAGSAARAQRGPAA